MQENLHNYVKTLRALTKEQGYKKPELFMNLPFDKENISKVMKKIEEIEKGEESIKQVVVIGIGGSSLGTKAIYEALKEKVTIKITFLDQINLKRIEKIAKTINEEKQEQDLVVVVTKSGKTLETTKNYELLKSALKKDIATIHITEKGSYLDKEGALYIPKEVGGRFSIFSPVGLFPLGLVQIDVITLLKGAMRGRKKWLDENSVLLENVMTTYQNYKEGKEIYNIFIFSPELKTLGYWYQQLIGESLGKEGKGLFPVVTEGSKDLHSLQQYFAGGKQNVQHEFLITERENKYQKTMMHAVQNTYKEKNIPFRTRIFEELNEETLGEFMEEKMIEILLLAKLLNVNPFGQPDVESYKKNTKKLLSHENQ